MDKTDKIIYLLAMLVAKGTEMTPEDVLQSLPKKEERIELDQDTTDMDVDAVYAAYPNKCPISLRATGKTSKDRKKIAKLLKKHSADEMVKIIEDYVNACIATTTYIKNFGTFLNNLPEREKEATALEPAKTRYR